MGLKQGNADTSVELYKRTLSGGKLEQKIYIYFLLLLWTNNEDAADSSMNVSFGC